MANTIKFLKKGIRANGKYVAVHYSQGALLNSPAGTITIYAKSIADDLPSELAPENNTDGMVDYFEKDRARITPDSPFYAEIMEVLK